MKRLAILFLTGFLVLLFTPTPNSGAASPRPRVDPRVLDDTATGATANFLIVMRAQAQPSAFAAPA
ncbi:MAG: hypothetical protein KGJ80_10230, partial [Chloroflexota bacterium]|nr:hypothetical protein [Chloroflexota bacterium]